MTSELQRDIALVQATIAWGAESAAPFEAWRRLKARLTPDRERVAMAIHDAKTAGLKGEDVWLARADAAIGAMRGP